MRIFWKKKTIKIGLSGWGLRSQTPALCLQTTITTLSSSILCYMHFITLKKKLDNYRMRSAFAYSAPIFHFKFCRFCWRGAQECFLPQGAGYPSYATV